MRSISDAIDEKWNREFRNLMLFDMEWLKDFSKISDREKKSFLVNDVENPQFKMKSTVDTSQFVNIRFGFTELKEEILNTEINSTVRDLYEHKIDNQLLRLQVLEASLSHQDEEYHQHSAKLYGQPKSRYFRYVATRVKCLIDESEHKDALAAKRRLKKIFAKIDTTGNTITAEMLPKVVKEKGETLSAKAVAQIFKSVVDKYGLSEWKIDLDTTGERRRFAVSALGKTVFVPTDERLLQRKHPLKEIGVRAIAEHEIGVHARRAFNGAKQPLKLLEIGLHSYIKGEEGLASYIQQHIEGADEFYGFDRYLALSLAIGLDGEKRDFRGVYECMLDYYLLMLLPNEDALYRAQQGAWEVCLRIFRGTTGAGVGTVFTRDLVYLEGNVGIWKLLDAHPKILEHLFIGKFDPLNVIHVEALRELDLLPMW